MSQVGGVEERRQKGTCRKLSQSIVYNIEDIEDMLKTECVLHCFAAAVTQGLASGLPAESMQYFAQANIQIGNPVWDTHARSSVACTLPSSENVEVNGHA
jgi:hypothetical protein